jgi:hypothetical protein
MLALTDDGERISDLDRGKAAMEERKQPTRAARA